LNGENNEGSRASSREQLNRRSPRGPRARIIREGIFQRIALARAWNNLVHSVDIAADEATASDGELTITRPCNLHLPARVAVALNNLRARRRRHRHRSRATLQRFVITLISRDDFRGGRATASARIIRDSSLSLSLSLSLSRPLPSAYTSAKRAFKLTRVCMCATVSRNVKG